MYIDDEDMRENDAKVRHPTVFLPSRSPVPLFSSGDPLIIFAGGLPRSSYSNKHSVSCLSENEHDHNNERTRHVTFDFTTSVIDFFTIDKLSNDGCESIAHARPSLGTSLPS